MYRIGVDLGGTNIAAGVVDEENKIVAKMSIPTDLPKSADEIARSIAKLAELVCEKADVDMMEVSMIGIGTPGAVNDEGVVENDANLGFVNIPLRGLVAGKTGKVVYVGNDANCAALGEQVAGAGKGTDNFIAVTLGTGIGGGVIVDGKLLTGINFAAGEIGHMCIELDGRACNCGNKGCFEAYASASALIRDARGVGLEVSGARDVFEAAQNGNSLAEKVVKNYISYLAVGITNLVNIFQPDMICIGGGIAAQGEYLLEPLRDIVAKNRYTKYSSKQTDICAAVLGNDAGIIGAANLGE
ncbi:MAG: ROK family protein [Clostridia bacterium]|nr:ROK family protein [Clostridia bacterium]